MFDTHIHHHTSPPAATEPSGELPLTILLAEIKEHAENIRSRVQLEQMVFNYSVVLVAALIPVSVQVISVELFAAFFFVPWVFCALATLVLRQDLMIACVARYMHGTLYPRIRRLAGDEDILRLEERLKDLRATKAYFAIGVARYAVFFLPSFAAIAGVVYLKYQNHQVWMAVDWTLLGIDAALISITMSMVAWMARGAFRRITEAAN